MDKEKEYERLSTLEIETTKIRHATFAGILSVSFVLPGLAFSGDSDAIIVSVLGSEFSVSQLVFFLGFLFYLFAVFHYAWYHRYSHRYRKALKELEEHLDINVYRLRVRPQLGPFKFHFDWALYIIGVIYAVITGSYVGWGFFSVCMGGVLVLYLGLLLTSYWSEVEPLEKS